MTNTLKMPVDLANLLVELDYYQSYSLSILLLYQYWPPLQRNVLRPLQIMVESTIRQITNTITIRRYVSYYATPKANIYFYDNNNMMVVERDT